MRKKLGVTEIHGWIQRGFGREMLVMQQKVIDFKACDNGWHDAVANEIMMQKHAEIYSKATGLNSKELTPNLEAL